MAEGLSPLLIRPESLVYYTPLVRDLRNLKSDAPTDGGATAVADHCRVFYFLQPQIVTKGSGGGTQTLTPALFTDTDSFYAPTVAASYTLTPSLFSDADTFYAPTVSATYSLTPGLLTDADSFFAPTVTATYAITPPL